MIVLETAIHQMTVKFKLLQVTLWPSTMNQSPYRKGSCKRPRNTNVKQYIKHDKSSCDCSLVYFITGSIKNLKFTIDDPVIIYTRSELLMKSSSVVPGFLNIRSSLNLNLYR